MVHFFSKKKKTLQNIIRYSKNMTLKKPNNSNKKRSLKESHWGVEEKKKKEPYYPSLFHVCCAEQVTDYRSIECSRFRPQVFPFKSAALRMKVSWPQLGEKLEPRLHYTCCPQRQPLAAELL